MRIEEKRDDEASKKHDIKMPIRVRRKKKTRPRDRRKTLKVALERLIDGQFARFDAVDAEYEFLQNH